MTDENKDICPETPENPDLPETPEVHRTLQLYLLHY